MGLLNKALRERKAGHPEAGAGLFAKALVSLEKVEAEPGPQPGPAAVEAPPAVEAEPLQPAEVESAPPRSVAEAYPLGAEELIALEAELQSFDEGPDALLLSFQRISEALPLAGLALYTACDGSFRPAAVVGFSVDKSGRIEESSLKAGSPEALEAAASTFLALSADAEPCRFRAERSEGSIAPLWVYGDSRLDSSPEEVREAVAALFRSIPGGGPLPAATYSPEQLPALLGENWTTAFFFDTAEGALPNEAFPGLTDYGKAAALRSAAELVLGGEGWAVLVDEASVLALLNSKQRIDGELALCQLRKSLVKALPSLGKAELPRGRVLSIQANGSDAEESLERFVGR